MKVRIRFPRRRFPAFTGAADVAFLVLIFLVLLSSAGQEDGIELPDYRHPRQIGSENSLSILVDSQARIFVDGALFSRSDLREYVLEIPDADSIVAIIGGDRRTEFSEIDWILQLLRSSGVRRILLQTGEDDAS